MRRLTGLPRSVAGSIAIVATAGPLLSACGTSTKSSTAIVSEPVRRVVIDVGRGDTVVTGAARNDVHVAWKARVRRAKPTFERHLVDGVLTLSAKCRASMLGACRIDQTVAVPAHTEVEVHAGSGAVRVDRAEASVTVQSGSGAIDLVRTGGVVRAQTGSGSVTIDRASDDVTVTTGSGSVAAKDLLARRLEVHTGSGDLTASFQEPPDDVTVDSASGDIEVTVPKGGYEVDTRASSGGSIEVKGLDKAAESPRHIRVSTASGSIKVAGK